MTKVDFIKLIKKVRQDLEESQAEFGKRFQVSHAAVSYWEAGRDEAPYEVIQFVLEHANLPLTIVRFNGEKEEELTFK